jgi:hypothetical protein
VRVADPDTEIVGRSGLNTAEQLHYSRELDPVGVEDDQQPSGADEADEPEHADGELAERRPAAGAAWPASSERGLLVVAAARWADEHPERKSTVGQATSAMAAIVGQEVGGHDRARRAIRGRR